jgi:hypothetical protein
MNQIESQEHLYDEYHIQNNESIFQVAAHFSVPLYSISQINPGITERWETGLKVFIPKEICVANNHFPFQFILSNEDLDIKCSIFHSDEEFVVVLFENSDRYDPITSIKYVSVLETHLSDKIISSDLFDEKLSSWSILTIEYFENYFNSSSLTRISFSGIKCDILSLQKIIMKKSQEFQVGLKLTFSRPITDLQLSMKSNCQYIGIRQSMISPFKIDLLRLSLGFKFRNKTWELLFQSKTNGTSFRNLVQKSKRHSTLVLCILTIDGYLFGCFLNTRIEYRGRYYGNGETFVFTFVPEI